MSRPIALAVAVTLALVATILSGCTQAPLTQEQAVVRTETAMASFSAAMSGGDNSELKRMSGSMESVPAGASMGGDDGFDAMFEDMTITMDIEWGKADVVHATLGMVNGGLTVAFESWCTSQGQIVKWGNDVLQSRSSDRTDTNAFCGAYDANEFTDGMGFLTGEEFSGMDNTDVVLHDGGTITATAHDPNDESIITIQIDKKGRIVRIETSGDGFIGAFDLSYGSRSNIAVPEANGRIPTKIETLDTYDYENDYSTHTVTNASEVPALSEFEARWVEQDFEKQETKPIYTFPLQAAGKQTTNDVSFQYHDEDADGRISPGDRYEIWSAPRDYNSESEYQGYREMILWDLWADGEVNDMPLPAPGFALVAGALLLLGLAMRRRP